MPSSVEQIEPQGSAETLASAPFDDTRADLILRSNDRVDFRVFKIILSQASPIFTDMFNIPPPAPEELPVQCQVVTLSEDSKSLDIALRHIYPIDTPTEVELPDACVLIEFARKYQVKALGPVVARSLTDAIENDPAGVYAIAVTYGEVDIAIKAARSSLSRPISHLQPSKLQLPCTTAALYGELIQYHIGCGEVASGIATNRDWFPLKIGGREWCPFLDSPYMLDEWLDCMSCATQDAIDEPEIEPRYMDSDPYPVGTYESTRVGPRCVWKYLYRSALVLARHPSAEAVTAEGFVLRSLDCPKCPRRILDDMLEFSNVFRTAIKEAIEKVSVSRYPQSYVVCDAAS
jgi:BTB/POZ domain